MTRPPVAVCTDDEKHTSSAARHVGLTKPATTTASLLKDPPM